jgi:hypothetical protein
MYLLTFVLGQFEPLLEPGLVVESLAGPVVGVHLLLLQAAGQWPFTRVTEGEGDYNRIKATSVYTLT